MFENDTNYAEITIKSYRVTVKVLTHVQSVIDVVTEFAENILI